MKTFFQLGILVSFTLALASCAGSQTVTSAEPKTESATPATIEKSESATAPKIDSGAEVSGALPQICEVNVKTGKTYCQWTPSHDAFIEKRVTSSMMASLPLDLCPKYASLPEKKKFWSALFQATSKFESGHYAKASMVEKFLDAKTKKLAISAGMLQLSIGDTLNYKGVDCQKLNAQTLLIAEINLACGMEIADSLLSGKPPFKKVANTRASLGRYWSTIRDGLVDKMLREKIPSCF